MKESKRIFPKKWPILEIEYNTWLEWLWFMFTSWWNEWNEYIFHIAFFFIEAWITLRKQKKYEYVEWMWEKSRSYWFFIKKDHIRIWYWKVWFPPETYWEKYIWFWLLREKIFWKPKFTKEVWEWKELEISVTDLYDQTKSNLHKYRYRYETRKWKYLLHTNKSETTEVEAIWDAPRIPWKWTCWYNQDDDSILSFWIKWFVWLPEVKKEIVAKIYYYRSYYPL